MRKGQEANALERKIDAQQPILPVESETTAKPSNKLMMGKERLYK
jgi:hypothetical protein